jgi:surface antigen
METLMKKTTLTFAAAILALGLGSTAARADDCANNRAGGTILGAIAGGVIGGAVSHGNGGAVVGGALLGGLAGNAIGRDMDCSDRPYAARSYHESFYGPVGQRYEWSHGRDRGYVVTNREYRRGRRWCRDFTQVVWHHGRELRRNGVACRREGGEWEFQ